ncbi:hypothetical protein V8G54_015225 [Vigna mungo]|uniref:Uncharacterized protein n=1 Tax=Vigna mungo TaxID=3915 RepID=A0AAQ3NI43_VIGMU
MIRERGKESAEEVKGDKKFEAWKQQIVFHLIWASFHTFESLHNFFLNSISQFLSQKPELEPNFNKHAIKYSLSFSIYKTMCLAMCQPHFISLQSLFFTNIKTSILFQGNLILHYITTQTYITFDFGNSVLGRHS